jgi:hypothetical protein
MTRATARAIEREAARAGGGANPCRCTVVRSDSETCTRRNLRDRAARIPAGCHRPTVQLQSTPMEPPTEETHRPITPRYVLLDDRLRLDAMKRAMGGIGARPPLLTRTYLE